MSSQTGKDPLLERLSQAMKGDWDRRAIENARWFINTVKLDQSEDEFDATGLNEVRAVIIPELVLLTQRRDPSKLKFLEIGCGIGRMTKHLASIFGEVHSTDVSGEMINIARARLSNLSNVHLYESNGVDLAMFPADHFDIAFSAYVFQHVPGKEIIEFNIREAYRVIKPGGLFMFHTNSVESESYTEMEKDTWAGATYTEADIRSLTRDLDARLISIYGAGTMFCWATIRKPAADASVQIPDVRPNILFHARSDNPQIKTIPVAGDYAWLSLVVSGLDREIVDANNLSVTIADREVAPRYVGYPRPHFESEIRSHLSKGIEELVYIEVGIPSSMSSGPSKVTVCIENDGQSPPYRIELEEPLPLSPKIVTVRNGNDFGTDIRISGPKSLVRLFVEYMDASANCDNVRVRIGDRLLVPDFVGFVTEIAGYQVDFQLPYDQQPGSESIELLFRNAVSEPVTVEILDNAE